VWRIAAPLVLSNITVPLLGIVDTAVVGHLDSPDYLAAVAVGAVVFGFLFTACNFLRMGTTGVAAQYFGADDAAGLKSLLGQSLLVVTGISALILVLQWPINTLALQLIAPEARVAALAAEYFHIRIWAAPAVLANFVLIGWFIGLSNGRAPLLIMVTINLLNIALDLLFVMVLDWRVAGVAAASVIAEYTGAVLGLVLAWRMLRAQGAPAGWRLGERAVFARLLSVNASLFVRTLALMFAFGFLTAQGARMGSLVLAANAVLIQFIYLLSYALDGLANAAEALVGRAVGKRDGAGLRRAIRVSMQWSIGLAVLFALAFALAGPWLIRLMTGLPEVREIALAHLPWLVAAPLVCLWPFLYDGVFVGATRAREMRDTMLLATFGVFVPGWYLLQGFGNHGLWAAFLLFMAVRGLGLHLWLGRLQRQGRLVPPSR
jgi:MATE family multidrug resistance protein